MSIAIESGNGTAELPNSPSITSFSEYHNQDGAESKIRTLRGDHDVGCRCEQCASNGLDLAADEDALDKGELDSTRDYLKDSTSHDVPIGKRSELQGSEHQTEWRKSQITPTMGIDSRRWRSMWLLQVGSMGDAPIETRWASDNDSNRETAHKCSLAEALCEQLGCTKKQRDRVVSKLKKIDVSRLGAHSDNRKAAIAVASIVTRDRRTYSELDTRREDYDTSIEKPVRIENSDAFERLCKQFGFNPNFISSTRESIEDQLDDDEND